MLKNRAFYFYSCLFSLLVTVFSYCQRPDVPYTGSYFPKLIFYLAGAEIRYNCDNRTMLTGTEIRSCQTNGRWDGKTPFCEVSTILRNPIGSSRVSSSSSPYHAIDDNVKTCYSTANGTGESYQAFLSFPAIVHTVRLYLPKGSAKFKIVTVRNWMKETCAQVNQLLENKIWLTVICESSSVADSVLVEGISASENRLEICEMKVYVKENNWCKDPPDVFIPNGWLFIKRTRAILKCNTGYKPLQNTNLLCNGGNWSQDVLQCEETIKPVLQRTNLQGGVLSVEHGTEQELYCYAFGVPEPTIFWKKDGLPFDVSNISGVELTHNKQRVMIKRVLDKDSGFYECVIHNERVIVTANVTLRVLPEIIKPVLQRTNLQGGVLSVEHGTEQELYCYAFGVPEPTIFWKKDGLPFDVSNISGVELTYNKQRVMIKRVLDKDSGFYECVIHNERVIVTANVTLRVLPEIIKPVLQRTNLQGGVLSAEHGTEQELYCYAFGVPEPTIFWKKDGVLISDLSRMSGVEHTDNYQRIVIKRVLDKDSGFYECLIQNKGGRVATNVTLVILPKNKVHLKKTLSKDEIFAIVVIIIVGVALFTLAAFRCVRVRADRKKKELAFLIQNAFESGCVGILNSGLPLVEQIDLLPYNHQFEFPKARLNFEKTLGQGAFGRVVKAEAIGLVNGEASTTVAVKMLKETANNEQRKALISELKILMHLGKHLNIVNLLGAVTKNIGKGKLMVIVEYCCFGSLRHYLLKHKGSYINQINPIMGELDPEYALTDLGFEEHHDNPSYGRQISHHAESMHGANNSDSGVESSSLPSAPSSTETYSVDTVIPVKKPGAIWTIQNKESTKQRVITTRDLLVYSFQCARGMEYLTSKKLIHRDLAARNVLLANKNVIKICDFGLTKDGYNYVKKEGDGGLLPVKWLAIESLRHKVFTSKSDVWAFGVLLWEIFTLGGDPYPGVEFNCEFVKKLEDGYRMEKPDLAPRSIYHMMQSCWLDDPTQRPGFTVLSEKIGLLLETGVRKYYIDLNIPYSVMNEEYLNSSGNQPDSQGTKL